MSNLRDFQEAGQTIYDSLHLSSMPIAIKYIKGVSEIPKEKTVRPSAMGEQWSLCQAFTYARRCGWNVAMTGDDNFCVSTTAFHGWEDVSNEDLLESQMRQGWHRDEDAERQVQDFARQLLGEDADSRNMGMPVKTHLARGITTKLTPGYEFLRQEIDGRKRVR